MIKFDKCRRNLFRGYDGPNEGKIPIYYNDEVYMLKFSSWNYRTNEETHSSINEHIACLIAKELGLNTQETILGKYNDKIVVACKDFEVDGFKLLNFLSIENSVINAKKLGGDLELDTILYVIENQHFVDKEELKTFFWDMFILDCLIANVDRRNSDWGILANERERICKIAPIYSCSSSFDIDSIEDKVENLNSAIRVKNKKINYYNFLTQTDNISCLNSLKKITARIDLEKINKIIMEIPEISDSYKKLIFTILKERKEKILDKALELNRKE